MLHLCGCAKLHDLQSWNGDKNQEDTKLKLPPRTTLLFIITHAGSSVAITDSQELNCEADETPPVCTEWLLNTINPPLLQL